MTLLILSELGATTQRALAGRLGVTEPSISRMATALAEAGFVDLRSDPAGGNRRQLTLTPEGKRAVKRCRRLLERRFEALVERSGVPYTEYAEHTRRLLHALDDTSATTPHGRPRSRP